MFEGVYTALVTPFHPDGSIDGEALGSLIEQAAFKASYRWAQPVKARR